MSKTQVRVLEFAEPFIDAAKPIFETMARTEVVPGAPEIRTDQLSKGDYSFTLGVSGEFVGADGGKSKYKGMVVISFPESTYLKIASAIFSEEYAEYSDEIADVGAEILNMIVGNAKRKLDEMGFTSSMAIPSSISGPNHIIRYPGPTTVSIIPIDSDHGPFFIEVAFQES